MGLDLGIVFQAILLSLLPISELRGGIPYAVARDISLPVAYIICVLSNILVIPLVFVFLETAHKLFYKLTPYRWFFDRWVLRTKKKAQKNIEKYGYWGIMLFVAIPLPVTGAYTGTLAAWILQLNKYKSSAFLALGVAAAGIIVSIATITGIGLLKIFIR
jgi:uncharacterized membrane protein